MARRWPTGTEYAEAIQQPSTAFPSVDYLAEGTLTTSMLGLPAMASGQNAVAFHMEAQGNPVAVRCFLGEQSDGRARYEAMAEHLLVRRIPGIVPAEWIDQGIRVNDDTWPVVVMPWVAGMPLHDAVEERLDRDAASLGRLADRWLDLVEALQVEGFTHGDLQHGNVLLDDDDSFRLVDLDGVWVESMYVGAPDEYGHPNYQHSRRSPHDWGPTTDTFSALAIGSSMLALAERPELRRFMTGENLLFNARDYLEPDEAEIWAELDQLSSSEALTMSQRLRSYCRMDRPPAELLTEALSGERIALSTQAAPSRVPQDSEDDGAVPLPSAGNDGDPWWNTGTEPLVATDPHDAPLPSDDLQPGAVAASSSRGRSFLEIGAVGAIAGLIGSVAAGVLQGWIDDPALSPAVFVVVVAALVGGSIHSWPAFRQRAQQKGVLALLSGALAGTFAAAITLAIADPVVESAVGFGATDRPGLVVFVWALAGAMIGFVVGLLRSPLAAAAALTFGGIGGVLGGWVFSASTSEFVFRGLVVDGLSVLTMLSTALVGACIAVAVRMGTRSARSGLLEIVDGPGSGAVIEAHRGRATIGGSPRDTVMAQGARPGAVTITFGASEIVATATDSVRLDGDLVDGTFTVQDRQVLGVRDLFVRVEARSAE